MGPTPRTHGIARATITLTGPCGEEVLFRGIALTVASQASALGPLVLLGAVAFVASHHVSPGTNGRASDRALLTEIFASAVLLILTLLSESLYPALLAHLLNNVPAAVLQLQRENKGRLSMP
ncbi:CPBP family intramembrane glutamic endopeptidase [Streptomyces sp. NPDC059853]|uniref:CPBP family intramembrane glutamic endopeptidase n=1 Tax=Streptomyces sp. NPDC059853 TaxID=3346973 RepID=UPI0036557323